MNSPSVQVKHGSVVEMQDIPSHMVIVLAAGKSTRMKSSLAKVAHPIAGRPLLGHVLLAAGATLQFRDDLDHASSARNIQEIENQTSRLVVVLGQSADQVEHALTGVPDLPKYQVVQQPKQLGTGDALRAVRTALPSLGCDVNGHGPSTVLVLFGDSPLVQAETLTALLHAHTKASATVSFLSTVTDRPTGYGRVLRDANGQIRRVIEERDATPEQRRINEVNTGVHCFASNWLWPRLDALRPHSTGEYYLTELVDLAAQEGHTIATLSVPMSETAGVNDRAQLAEAEAVMRKRILDALMLAGVTVVDTASTFIDADVRIGPDTVIRPFTLLHGRTVIGKNCDIGPHSVIRDSTIGDRCTVRASWVEAVQLAADVCVGPMSHLSPGAPLTNRAPVNTHIESQ